MLELYEDSKFDFILANQVLYYMPRQLIINTCMEFKRILKPGGIVFFTMMSVDNHYIKHYTKRVENGMWEIEVPQEKRLAGTKEIIYPIPDKETLCDLFSMFKLITTGFFAQGMFDMLNTHHWIFVGEKR